MQKPVKNLNFNARFVAAGSCAAKFSGSDLKFYPCGAEPRAHGAELGGFKFRNERLLHTRQIPQSRHSHFKFNVEKFNGANFAIYGTEFLKTNFRGMEFCKSKFRARAVKFYKARSRETGFLARTAKFYATEFAAKSAKFFGAKRRGAGA